MTTTEILLMVRDGIGDYKTTTTRVVDEIVTTAYQTTGDDYEIIYYTQNLPIASGSSEDVYFNGGRWRYEIADTGDDDVRWIKWVSTSGSFVLDSGATQVTADTDVRIGYSWAEPQEYDFRDEDLLRYIRDAAYWINKETCDIVGFSATGSANEGTLTITPAPSAYTGLLISKIAQLTARQRIQSEADTSGIFVRQGPVTIDTTKGGSQRIRSLTELKSEIMDMILTILTADTSGRRIDLYSTYDDNIHDQGYWHETNTDQGDDIGEIG